MQHPYFAIEVFSVYVSEETRKISFGLYLNTFSGRVIKTFRVVLDFKREYDYSMPNEVISIDLEDLGLRVFEKEDIIDLMLEAITKTLNMLSLSTRFDLELIC